MEIKVIGKKFRDWKVFAHDLKDAYKKSYFNNSITRDELMERVTKYNPQLRWYANATHRGLFDSTKKRAFICGIGHQYTLPLFTIMRSSDGYVFARSWRAILQEVKRNGYEIFENDLPGTDCI